MRKVASSSYLEWVLPLYKSNRASDGKVAGTWASLVKSAGEEADGEMDGCRSVEDVWEEIAVDFDVEDDENKFTWKGIWKWHFLACHFPWIHSLLQVSRQEHSLSIAIQIWTFSKHLGLLSWGMLHIQHVTGSEHVRSHFRVLKATTWTRTIMPVLTMADSKTASSLQAAKGGS